MPRASRVINIGSLKLTRRRRMLLISACSRLTVFRECCATEELRGGAGLGDIGRRRSSHRVSIYSLLSLSFLFLLTVLIVSQMYIIILNVWEKRRKENGLCEITLIFLHNNLHNNYFERRYNLNVLLFYRSTWCSASKLRCGEYYFLSQFEAMNFESCIEVNK